MTKVDPQPNERVIRNPAVLEALRNATLRPLDREIGDEVVRVIHRGECPQQVAHVSFIARQVSPNGVRVYRKPHGRSFSIAVSQISMKRKAHISGTNSQARLAGYRA
jgi:hypothetical protein